MQSRDNPDKGVIAGLCHVARLSFALTLPGKRKRPGKAADSEFSRTALLVLHPR